MDFDGFAVPQGAAQKDAAEQFILSFMAKPQISLMSTRAGVLTPRIDVPAPAPLQGVQTALTNRTVIADQDALLQKDPAWYTEVLEQLSVELVTGKVTAPEFVAKLRTQSYAFWASQG